MKFTSPLVKGHLIKRYKRFLADIELENGLIVTAHCANPGSMMGLKEPGLEVYLSPSSTGQLQYRWELVKMGNHFVGINTSHPNKLVEEALNKKLIQPLSQYVDIRREVKYGQNSRVDFLLQSPGLSPCYLEVKNAHLKRDKGAEFPDSVTKRGAKHLQELTNMVKQGNRAVILYIVQRTDCSTFSLAYDIDPEYAAAAKMASESGVERLCYGCDISLEGITISQEIPIQD